jgi:hypothetical protein
LKVRLTAFKKVQLLRYASSFVAAKYYVYASLLKIRKPCIWGFLLCRLMVGFYWLELAVKARNGTLLMPEDGLAIGNQHSAKG